MNKTKTVKKWAIVIVKHAGSGNLMGSNFFSTKKVAEKRLEEAYFLWKADLKIIPVTISYQIPSKKPNKK